MNYLTKFIAARQFQSLMPMFAGAGASQGLFRNFSMLRMAGEEVDESLDTGENPPYAGDQGEGRVERESTEDRHGQVTQEEDERLGSDFEQRDIEQKSHP